MPEYDIKTTFDGAISGCYVKRFEANTTVEINDPELVAVALKEGWIETHVEVEDGSDSTIPQENGDVPKADAAKVLDTISKPLTDEEKAAIKAPKNKAAKAAPKAKDTATE